MTRQTECIYCGADTGSREHTIQAGIGGLKVNKRIQCGGCNNAFSDIDDELANALRPLNAQLGVHHGSSGSAIGAAVQVEPERTYLMSDAGNFRHLEPLVLSDHQKVDGSRERYVVASTEEQISEYIQKVRAEGRPYTVVRDDRIPLYFAESPIIPQNFGGVRVFRAVAKSALNVMAYRYPERAREPWLAPVKEFIRFGGNSDPWVNFEYPEDVCVRTISGRALSPHRTSVLDPSKHVERRLTLLLQKISDLAWEREAPSLVAELTRM